MEVGQKKINQNSIELKEALLLASEMVLHKKIILTYKIINIKPPSILSSEITSLLPDFSPTTPSLWAKKMNASFKNKKFASLIYDIISKSNQPLWSATPRSVFPVIPDAVIPMNSPEVITFNNIKQHLCGDRNSPRWTAIVFASFSRMIAVNSSSSFDSNQWSELSLLWFDLEKSFLKGKGKLVAEQIITMNEDFMDGKLSEIIASKLPTAIGEMIINALDTRFFSEL